MKRIFLVLIIFCCFESKAQFEADSTLLDAWELCCYPNPTSDLLMIKSSKEIQDIEIFDLNGSLVRACPMSNWCYSLSDLPEGWLFFYIHSVDGLIEKKNVYKY